MSRIRQLRLAKGMSLDRLVAAMDGVVTKQALSKYERGLSRPGPVIAARLASALGVKTLQLWQPPAIAMEIVGYRRLSGLGKKECAQIETTIFIDLEKRCRLQERLGTVPDLSALVQSCPVTSVADAENCAQTLRRRWQLGQGPIANLHAVLDANYVHTISIHTERRFDGLCAVARNPRGRAVAAALTSRDGLPGDRQRMNLSHELGHLFMQPQDDEIDEAAAFRFAGAFLVPREALVRALGERRTNIQVSELIALKRQFKVSIAALLYRLRDLEIISPTYYTSWMIELGRRGWRTNEPEAIPSETSDWLTQMTTRALSEGLITRDEAREFDRNMPDDVLAAATSTQAEFLKLPRAARQQRLAAAAAALQSHYDERLEDLETGLEDE